MLKARRGLPAVEVEVTCTGEATVVIELRSGRGDLVVQVVAEGDTLEDRQHVMVPTRYGEPDVGAVAVLL